MTDKITSEFTLDPNMPYDIVLPGNDFVSRMRCVATYVRVINWEHVVVVGAMLDDDTGSTHEIDLSRFVEMVDNARALERERIMNVDTTPAVYTDARDVCAVHPIVEV